MRMSRASAYAIGAVIQLADAPVGRPVPCSQLAKAGEMPERFLLQVLRHLVNHGILKSTRGVEGGYSLVRSAREISLLQILEATDGPLTPELPPLECIPSGIRSRLHTTLREITAESCRRLANITLVDLIESPGPKVRSQEGKISTT